MYTMHSYKLLTSEAFGAQS